MSAIEAGYPASGGMRKSSAATTTPLFASGSLSRVSFVGSPHNQAPPGSSTISGKGPTPRGLKRRASSGLAPWRRYSTSSTSIADVTAALVGMICSHKAPPPPPPPPHGGGGVGGLWVRGALFLSPPLELRAALLREGTDALLVVLAVEAVGDQALEHGEIAFLRGPQQLVHGRLGRAGRQRGGAGGRVG